MLELSAKINDIVDYLSSKLTLKPELGIILGSGLGDFVTSMEEKQVIPYLEIPHLPASTAPGHAGNLVVGKVGGKVFMAMQGRFHVYEGYNPQLATLLVRAMKKLGVETLFITGASGGLNRHYDAGDIMLIIDHINFSGTNPLLGTNLSEFGPRFPVMFDIYAPKFREIAHQVALEHLIKLHQGVYAGILGPTYATRAELQYYIDSGCDAIGMSVVQEATVAAHSGMQIIGLSAITDMALPYVAHHTTEDEVVAAGKRIAGSLKTLIVEIAKRI